MAAESPLKMMENDFYFTLKALFALKISEFLFSLFSHAKKNGLIRKKRLNSKLKTSQTD